MIIIMKDMKNGIISFALKDIFNKRDELQTEGIKVEISMNFIEIYMEECFDLLSNEKSRLEIKELANGKFKLIKSIDFKLY